MTRPHPSFETLLDLAEGRPVPSDVRPHLGTCEACKTLAGRVEALVATMSEARQLDDVPAGLRVRTVEAVREELARRSRPVTHVLRSFIERLGDEVRLLTAALAGDSLEPSHATRAGTGAPVAPRMLVYEAAGYEITISLAAGDRRGTLDVSGQVTPSAGELEAGGEAGLRAGTYEATAPLSGFGEFAFDAVPAGELELEVGVGRSVIRLAPIPRPTSE